MNHDRIYPSVSFQFVKKIAGDFQCMINLHCECGELFLRDCCLTDMQNPVEVCVESLEQDN